MHIVLTMVFEYCFPHGELSADWTACFLACFLVSCVLWVGALFADVMLTLTFLVEGKQKLDGPEDAGSRSVLYWLSYHVARTNRTSLFAHSERRCDVTVYIGFHSVADWSTAATCVHAFVKKWKHICSGVCSTACFVFRLQFKAQFTKRALSCPSLSLYPFSSHVHHVCVCRDLTWSPSVSGCLNGFVF